ncbi:MAG TPA: hypothetical protein VFH95_06420 [Candidatus Kapabacteria bacterium]|nr:hypothetical protein [Candidatus Kapabacteria bacterium]
MKHKHYLFPVVALLMLSACETATTPPNNPITVVPSTRTLFLANEGSYGSNNSSLDAILFHHDSTGYDTILNHGVLTGMGEANDILIAGNRVIVLDEYSNAIHIVDADSLRPEAVIPMGTDGPNKMALIGPNLLMVTRRNQTSAAIIDLTSNTIVDTIGLGEPSIAVAVLNNKAFLTGGTYGGTGHLHVIDLSTRHQIASNTLLSGPERAVADSTSGQIVIASDGIYQTVAGRIYWVNATTNALVDSANAVNDSATITFTTGGRVSLIENGTLLALDNVNHSIGAPILLSSKTVYFEGYYDAATNAYYMGNAGNFVNAGTLDAYNASTAALEWSRPTGIAPGHFAFYH